MSDTNLHCKHRQLIKCEKETTDFCKKCGCFLIVRYSKHYKEIESFSVLPGKIVSALDIRPYDTFDQIFKQIEANDLRKFLVKIPEDYIQVRKSLIELLNDYIIENNFGTRSYFLGIYMLDYIFLKHSKTEALTKLKQDLLVLGVFLVAVKFIEDDAYPPTLDSFSNKMNPTLLYSLSEVRKYEFIAIKLLDFKLDIHTSYYITETILSHGIVFTYELNKMGITDSKSVKDKIKKVYRLALDINKMFAEDIESLNFTPLEIAATSIIMAKELMKFETTWNKELEYLYKIESDKLIACYSTIVK